MSDLAGEARPQRVPELGAVAYEAAEMGALRDRLENLAAEWAKRAKVARNRSAQTAGHMAERYDECADMLEHCAAGLRRVAGNDGAP